MKAFISILTYLVFICYFCFAGEKNLLEEKSVQRIKGHFLLRDFSSALEEGFMFLSKYPFSDELQKAYIKALALSGREAEAIERLKKYFMQKADLKLLEDIAWSILENGTKSSQYSIKLTSLIGAYLTRDVRTVKIISNMMQDSNAIVRMIAVKFSCDFQDEVLKRQISYMLHKEKVWLVKLEVIKAAGIMKLKKEVSFLSGIAASMETTYDERAAAVGALINIYENISEKEIKMLLHSPKAGLREFACEAAMHFMVSNVKDELLNLALDPISDVRMAAIHALVFLESKSDKFLDVLKKCESDVNVKVAITAAWARLVLYNDNYLEKWFFDSNEENRRFAAAALAMSGKNGVSLAKKILHISDDQFVKLNIAIGLIGQREEIKKCQNIIYEAIKNKKQMWMWDQRGKFLTLSLSQIRHIDQIPNYPEAVDQMTELQIIALLSITEDSRAAFLLKSFMKEKRWGISGVATVTLLREGDEDSLKIIKGLLDDQDINIRTQAALVLAIYGKDDSVVGVLEKAYESADRELKLHILEALGFAHASASFNFFLNVFDEPFQILRIAGASSLIQTLNK